LPLASSSPGGSIGTRRLLLIESDSAITYIIV
jgi:hypothetical protein